MAGLVLLMMWAAGVGTTATASARPQAGSQAAATVDLIDFGGLLQTDLQHNAFAKLFATDEALRRAGFTNAQIVPNTQGDDIAVIATPSAHGPSTLVAADVAARTVWESFADSFGGEIVTISGQAPRTYGHAQLQAAFGSRPAGFDSDSAGGDLGKTTLVAGVLLLDAIGLLVALVHAVRHTVRALQRVRRFPWAAPVRSSLGEAGLVGLYVAGLTGVLWASLWLVSRA